jgi:hypothetical protein
MIRREACCVALLLAIATPFTANAQRKGGGIGGAKASAGHSTQAAHSGAFQQASHQQMMAMQQRINKQQQQQSLQQIKTTMAEVRQLSQEMKNLRLSGKNLVKHARRYGWYVVGPYWWLQWPKRNDPIYKPLNNLKTTLDTIATTRQPTDPENVGLQKALYMVHDPETLYPSQAAVAKLASNVTTALIKRGEGAKVDTSTLAAHLQGTMNSLELSVPEFMTSLVQQKALLEQAQVQDKHSEAILDTGQQIATDVLSRLYD